MKIATRPRALWAIAALFALVTLPVSHFGHILVFIACAVLAAVTVHRAVQRHRPPNHGIWYGLAGAVVLFATSFSLRILLPDLMAPIPSGAARIPDYIDASAFVVIITVLSRLGSLRDERMDSARIVDALIISGGLATLVWMFRVLPNIETADIAVSGRVVSIVVAVLSIWLSFCVVRLALGSKVQAPSARYLNAAAACALVAEICASTGRAYISNELLVAGTFGAILLTFAARHPSMAAVTTPVQRLSGGAAEQLTTTRLGLMSLALVVAPGALATRVLQHGVTPFSALSLVALWLLTTSLVMIRLGGLTKARERVVTVERSLSRATAALVVSSDLQGTYHSALRSILGLLDGDAGGSSVSLALKTTKGWNVVADNRDGDRPASATLVPSAVMEAYLSGDTDRGRLIQRNLHTLPRAGANHAGDPRELVHFNLHVQGGTAGTILVSTPRALSREQMHALHSLASSVSLAFEAAALTENLNQRRNEAQFRSLVEKSPDIIVVVNRFGKTTFVSPVGEELLGTSGSSLEELLRPLQRDDQLALLSMIERTKNGADVEALEFRIVRGVQTLWFEAVVSNLLDDRKVQGVVLNARNISERKSLEHDLRHKVLHDALTGIANRTLFRDRLDHALRARERNPGPKVAVLFIDLDDFKTVNDGLGHDAGDELLKVVAFRLESHVRAQDTAARLGGDEFAILLEGLESTEAVMEASHRVLDALKADVEFGDRSMAVGASIGVAIAEGDTSSEMLLRNADVAMYDAKRNGKHTVKLFDQSMYISAVERLELKADVVHAASRGQLAAHYQPLVRLSDNKLLGFEALLRWNHPTMGWVSPDSFIPLAEETGAIFEMGKWILNEALTQLKQWHKVYGVDIGMNVNVSPLQLTQDRIITDVSSAIANAELESERVTLEITEGQGLEDEDSRRRLIALRSLGCRVAADDFGTGFASYAALQQLPFTDVKIDRSLIRGLSDGDPRARAQVQSIIQMGHALGLSITAEGIEDARQADALIAMKTNQGQGYLIGRPASANTAVEHFAGSAEIMPSWW